MAKKNTSVSIDLDLYEKLVKMADKEERSVSQQVAYLIKNAND